MRTEPPRLSRGEILRKVVHIGCGGFALLLRWLPAWGAWLLAGGALALNALALPALTGHALERDGEKRSGRAWGIIFYPLSVLVLTLVFPQRLEIAAAAWGMMAFGDGGASVVGRLVPVPRLPWNPDKSVAGSLAFLVFGAASAWALLLWVAGGHGRDMEAATAAWVAIGAAVVAAFLESLPTGIDDNLSVPLAAGACLYGLGLVDPARLAASGLADAGRLATGVGVNLGLGLAAQLAGTVTVSGMLTGLVLGTVIWAGAGPAGFAMLLAFFVLGSATTRVGYAEKHAAGIAQDRGGRRSARNALANGGAGAVLAFLAASTPHTDLFLIALAAAFATAAFDTVSSEIGQVYGRHPVLVTTFRRVPRGTEGAVSVEGTAAGMIAALLVAVLAWGTGLVAAAGVIPIVAGAFVGAMGESYLGATLESMKVIDNEMVNFLNTVAGALTALGLAWLLP